MKKLFVINLVALLSTVPAYAAVNKKINAFGEGEKLLYTRIVEAFGKNDLASLVHNRQLLQKNYPSSIHLDNAYYLSGMLEFQADRIGESVRTFNLVTDRFPKSNKRPAALFGLAMAYKRLNLTAISHRVLNSIIKQYPGSPESQRAWMQLEMDKKASVKR